MKRFLAIVSALLVTVTVAVFSVPQFRSAAEAFRRGTHSYFFGTPILTFYSIAGGHHLHYSVGLYDYVPGCVVLHDYDLENRVLVLLS